MFDLEFKPIHNFFRITILSIKYMKHSNSDTISLHVYSISPYQLTLPLSTILDEELSINNIISNEKRNTDYFTKTPYFKSMFKISHYTEKQQKFLTVFNFQHSQITQKEFDKLAELLLKFPTVYATSKFDVGKISSPLYLPLKPDAVFKKQRASKVPIHLQDKVNRLLDILTF